MRVILPSNKNVNTELYTTEHELTKDYQILCITKVGSTNAVDAFGKKLELDWYIRSSKSGALFQLPDSPVGSWNHSRMRKFIKNECEWNEIVPGSSAVVKFEPTSLSINQPSGGSHYEAVMLLFGANDIGLSEYREIEIGVVIK